jgi:enamine deaminase RidA (YjgF/YER057c/UK114 family)
MGRLAVTWTVQMPQRIPSIFPTRSRSVIHNRIVTTVAVSNSKASSLYIQACDALATIDRNLKEAGTTKAKILTAMVYITDIRNKPEFNRAWDEWVDLENPPLRACLGVPLEGDDLVEIVVTAEAGAPDKA